MISSQFRRDSNTLHIDGLRYRDYLRRANPGLGFFSFKTARRTIKGFETMIMIRKGQIDGVGKGAIQGQLRFVNSLFGVAA
jgi:transposase, IS6 family